MAHELTHVVQQVGAVSVNPAARSPTGEDVQGTSPHTGSVVNRFACAHRSAPQVRTRITPGAMLIQRSLQGAAGDLRVQGGGISHQARAKKVLSLGSTRSTYDRILEAVARYEREEQRGQRSTAWFQKELSTIERLCNAWLANPKHAQAREVQESGAVARANSLQVLLERVAAERLVLTPPAHQPAAVMSELDDDELTMRYGAHQIQVVYRGRDESRIIYSVAPDPNITTGGAFL